MAGPWEDFAPAASGPWSDFAPQPSVAGDVATQFGTHVGQFLEQAPGIGPSLMAAAGRGVQYLGDKFAPGFLDAEKEKQRQEFMATNKPPMLINPPEAKTGPGQVAGTAGDLIGLALGRGSIGQRAARVAVPTVTGEVGEAVGGPTGKLIGVLAGAAGTAKVQAGQAERAAMRAAPTAAETKDAAVASYTNLRSGNIAVPVADAEFATVRADIKHAVERSGPDPLVAKEAHGIIDKIMPRAPDIKTGAGDIADLVTARQRLKDFFSNPMPDPNKAVAALAIPKIDKAIERLSPGTMKTLREADRDYSTAMTAERFDKRVARAEMRAAGEHSGMNLGNKLRQNATTVLLSNKETRGLSAAEKDALESLVRGTFTQNAMRFGSNLLGGGGGLGSTALGVGLAGTGLATGAPEAMLAPVAGFGLRSLYNRSVANQAARLSAQIRNRSPYAESQRTPMLGSSVPMVNINNPAYKQPPRGILSEFEQQLLATALAQRGLLPYDQSTAR